MLQILIILLISYLIGSIPFGVVIGRFAKVDLQKSGSGNIGATNALRTMGKKLGALVFVLDFLKGALPTYLAVLLFGDPVISVLVGFMTVIGHIFPIWLGFNGGKGVATTAGIILPLTPDLFFIGLVFFVAIVFLTRFVSLGSVSIMVLVSILMFLLQKPLPYSILTVALSILVIYKHKDNLKRLMDGTENKIGEVKK